MAYENPFFGDKFGESLGGSRAPPSFWKVPGSSPNFPGSFSATSPEVLLLWNLTVFFYGFPGSFPDFPGSSPDFPGGFPDFPGGQPLFLGSLTPSLDSQNLVGISAPKKIFSPPPPKIPHRHPPGPSPSLSWETPPSWDLQSKPDPRAFF